MDLKDVMHAVRAGWTRIAAGVLLGLLVAGALSLLSTPQYSSTTRLFVSAASAPDTSAAYEGDLFSQERVASYAEMLTMEVLAARVVDDLGLSLTPEQVARKVTATVVPETVLLDVTVTDTSAERARDIAASLGRQFRAEVARLESPAGAGSPTIEVTTLQPAQLDRDVVSPDVPRNLALGAVLGLLAGVALALLRRRLDNTVKSREHVQEITGKGLIGSVPQDPRLDQAHVIAVEGGYTGSAEAFRGIRTSLQFLDVDHPPRVIVVTSSVPGEGKTTLAVNLAAALGQSGSRVMLVEADLRRPRVTRYMGLIGGAGLTNVLAGSAELAEVTQPWRDGNVTVLAAGPMPPSPSEMLGSAQMRALLETLRTTHDFVVVDSPPLLPVTDAAVLAALADGCVVTAWSGVTRREVLAEAVATLSRVGARCLGVVLNGVRHSTALGQGYGYGYEADPDRGGPSSATVSVRARRRRWGRIGRARVPAPLVPAVRSESGRTAS